MANIRPCSEADLPQIGNLYLSTLAPDHPPVSREETISYLGKLLFRSPWHDESMPSLLYEMDGQIVGFVGRVPRHMLLKGRRILVSVICHFMVSPKARSTLAGISLLRRALQGPADLSLCEGNDLSKRVWKGVGGAVSHLESLHWVRVLRPAGYAALQVSRIGLSGRLKSALQFLSRPADYFLVSMAKIPLYTPPQPPEEELTDEALLRCLSEFPAQDKLRPEYNQDSLAWLLDFLGEKNGRGTLRKTVVRDASDAIIGWYLYYAGPGEVSIVAQIGARAGSYGKVFRHLFYHARKHGAIAVSGRVGACLFEELPGELFFRRRSWMQIHSTHPELIEAFEDKEAFFTPLEGEWWTVP
jgi:hypothetical protein